jgi:hypothetical protein
MATPIMPRRGAPPTRNAIAVSPSRPRLVYSVGPRASAHDAISGVTTMSAMVVTTPPKVADQSEYAKALAARPARFIW